MYERSSKIRYFVRTTEPSIGFIPWGLLGLLFILLPLLYGLTWFARKNIESNTRTAVEKKLAAADMDWVDVEVDGQDVSLTGVGPKSDESKAIQLAENAEADTWLGSLTAPISAKADFSKAEIQSAQTAITAPDVERRWGTLNTSLNNGVLTLEGTVGNEQEKRALIQNAKNKILPPKITELKHNISVVPDSVDGSMELAMLTTELLSRCENGSANAKEGVLSLSCEAQQAQADAIKSLNSSALYKGSLGDINVNIVGACNVDFTTALKDKSINFDVGSSSLPASSSKLLDSLAKLINSCPEAIRIDGHTDESGNYDFNMSLSFRRAMSGVEALADRGVDRKYLIPYAHGPNKLLATEGSQEAKAQNRRIEFQRLSEGDN